MNSTTAKAVILALLCAIVVFAQAPADPAQTGPATSAVSVPAPDPVAATVNAVPKGTAKESTLWWVSVATNGMGTYLKWSASWKQPTTDLIHAEPNGPYQGRYYVRGTIYDWGTLALTTLTQYLLVRKFPSLKKTFAYVNFGSSAASAAQYGYFQATH